MVERFLTGQGLTLIRAMEAGARTSLRMMGSAPNPLRVLVEETARTPSVAYVWLVDGQGRVVARAGEAPRPEPPARLEEVLAGSEPVARTVRLASGGEAHEVARVFDPLRGRGVRGGVRRRWQQWCGMGLAAGAGPELRLAAFVGLRTDALVALRAREVRQSLMLGGLLLLTGAAGLGFVLLRQRVRAAQEALEDLESHTRDVIESLPHALVTLDAHGRVRDLNGRAERLFGVSVREAAGRPLGALLGEGGCADLERLVRAEARLVERPAECPGPDGKPVPVKVSAAALTDRTGRRVGTVLVIRDVRELRAVEEQLERSRRLAALGHMAAGLAHEIRNPLGTLRGFAQYFGTRLAGDEEAEGYARIMVDEIDRLDRLIGALLRLARPREPEPRDVPLAPLVERVLALARQEAARAGVRLGGEVPEGLSVRADPDLLTQMLLNLVQNAVAATPAGGRVSVLARGEGGEVAVAVDDTGRGLTPEEREHMFDPFYTTRPAGTGLGLALVHQIVEQHGGRIEVESIRGRGTRVTVWLAAAGAGP